MSVLVTADIHLTDKDRDQHRWSLFPWLVATAKKNLVKQVVVCGDLTDVKDRHSAVLTNRLCSELVSITKNNIEVVVLLGNHDYIDPKNPFFAFVDKFECVRFIHKATLLDLSIGTSLFIPSTSEFEQVFKEWVTPGVKYVFSHQTFDGSQCENGSLLKGIPLGVFKDFKGTIYSGDIHTPQKISKYGEYVGSPYRIDFGDTFLPRILLINDDGSTKDLYFPSIGKYLYTIGSIQDLKKEKAQEGAQVKIRVKLRRRDYDLWPELKQQIKEYAEAKRWQLFGPELIPMEINQTKTTELPSTISPKDILGKYAKDHNLTKDQLNYGISLLDI